MWKKLTWFKYLWFTSFILIISTALAVIPNQFDNFQDGTTQGWGSGISNPTPPVNVTSGGPTGATDNYLHITANGGSSAGGKLVIINTTQWTGNYIGAGVQSVSMNIKNFSNTVLSLRIALRGPGGDFWSVDPVIIAAQSDWQPIVFSIQPANLTGGVNVNATLAGVSTFRILHSLTGEFIGDPIAAQIGLDNITAASQPVLVEGETELLNNFTLEQNYPNPFNPSTKIRFSIPSTEKVKIEVFNTTGNKVATLLDELKIAGSHEIELNADNWASGVYFYKVSARNFISTKKMILLK